MSSNVFTYGPEDKFAPIPANEAAVQTVVAEPWLEISKELVEKCADDVWESYECSTWFKPLTSKQELLDFMMLAWE